MEVDTVQFNRLLEAAKVAYRHLCDLQDTPGLEDLYGEGGECVGVIYELGDAIEALDHAPPSRSDVVLAAAQASGVPAVDVPLVQAEVEDVPFDTWRAAARTLHRMIADGDIGSLPPDFTDNDHDGHG
jgi:hypothetical protein